MLVTMIISVALMGGAAALVSLQLGATRSADITRSKMSSLHCAEAGLVTARATVAAKVALWNAALGKSQEPSWLASLNHDIDGDNKADFRITLRDNADEVPQDADDTDDPGRDNDLSIFIVSSCIKYADTPTEVIELVRFNGGGSCYDAQLGGCGGNSNAN